MTATKVAEKTGKRDRRDEIIKSERFILEYTIFESPLGWIILAATPEGISLVDFAGPEKPSAQHIETVMRREYPSCLSKPAGSLPKKANRSGVLDVARAAIADYFENRRPLAGVPLDVRKGSAFEKKVWGAISAIPFGLTRSYKQVAQAAGNPAGARAAGRACGRNPVPLFVPCHRVVTSSGKLGGFSGGLNIKSTLLDLEGVSGVR